MGTVDDFILSIKNKEGLKFDGQVADLINIDRRVLANYKHKDSLPFKLQEWYCDRYDIEIKDFHKKIKLTNTDIQLEGEKSMDARYVIDLQRDKIKQQEKEIAMYRDYLDTQPLQKLQFDEIAEHMSSTVYVRNVFSLKPMERKMGNFHNAEIIEEKLGLPKEHEFWAENQWFTFDQHPVDTIIDKHTLGKLKKITKTLPSLFESLKFMVGSHYMTFPVVYEYNDKRLRTMCYILLDWISSPKRILTKSIILNGKKD
tara:strand:- start:395 stop:1165 length:771 start_codon:yes stop_codon:yes gene_type:complete